MGTEVVILKQMVYGLKGHYYQSDDLVKTIIHHATGATVASAAAGILPGAGGVAALAVSTGIICKMYVTLGKMLNIRIGEGVLKALASAVLADVAGAFAVNLAAGFVFGLIPGLGSVAASTISAMTGFCYVYLAGVVYIKLVSEIIKKGKDPSNLSQEELLREAKAASGSINMKKAVSEAKGAFKDHENDAA